MAVQNSEEVKTNFFCLDLTELDEFVALTCPKPSQSVLKKIHKCCPPGKVIENAKAHSCKDAEGDQDLFIPIDGHIVELKKLGYNSSHVMHSGNSIVQ